MARAHRVFGVLVPARYRDSALMIACAQDVERFANQANVENDAVASFYEEIGFFPPVKYFPGIIGGVCVMPNIGLLSRLDDTTLLRAIRDSNQRKKARADKRPP